MNPVPNLYPFDPCSENAPFIINKSIYTECAHVQIGDVCTAQPSASNRFKPIFAAWWSCAARNQSTMIKRKRNQHYIHIFKIICQRLTIFCENPSYIYGYIYKKDSSLQQFPDRLSQDELPWSDFYIYHLIIRTTSQFLRSFSKHTGAEHGTV